ncbi:MAG: hypothetical protein Q7T55_05545 [Solirubrobacteraceae bacterium]|nr:hypothetical protein [Solirubrobacteraceae bacterium]
MDIDDEPDSPSLLAPRRSGSAPVDLLRRPLQVLWPHHSITAPLAGQANLSVPLAGGPPRADAATKITRHLQQLWVRNPLTAARRITSVAAAIVKDAAPGAPADHRLILILTYDQAPDDQPLDAGHMGRHLEAAVAALG